MACGNLNNAGVTRPIFRVKLESEIFNDVGNFRSFYPRLLDEFLQKTMNLKLFQGFEREFRYSDLISALNYYGSGDYIFCTLKTPFSFKLTSNEVYNVSEKYKTVQVLRNRKKINPINLNMHIFKYSDKVIYEYLFFILLYRFRSYLTFTLKVDYINKTFVTIFGYDFVSCVMNEFEIGANEKIDEFGNIETNVPKPFVVKMNLIPYDVRIRL